ncbi:cell division protein FtsQ [Chryseobacterium sp. POL2]|uniref:cell division protein FtsQ/DivIB n=1 Tax=Chryseobacterium sp. POL2 TaxID=2713414 RepID=UPI0013E1C916|nr:cell division protein FtsQ [Chryseobacterium sp. POL2]QIG89971.1 cell division protein FtsQ [Chryseobacterium sp. POL2]
MKNKYRILKILVTVGILVFLLSFSLKRFSEKSVSESKIKLNNDATSVYFISENEVSDLIKKYNPENKIGTLDIPKLEEKLNKNDFVDSANVYLDLNGTLNVDVKQRVPVFRLQKEGRDFYVDAKGVEFPISRNYSYPCLLVSGNVKKDEYAALSNLVEKINKDDFSKKYFIGISKYDGDYSLLTSEGHYKVEIGDLNNIDFKVKGFKTFVEKYLVYQNPEKYKRISVKYNNQIVATLNPYFKENDSVLKAQEKALEKPLARLEKKEEVAKPEAKPKATVAKPKKEPKKEEKQKTQQKASPKKEEPKKKAKVIVE